MYLHKKKNIEVINIVTKFKADPSGKTNSHSSFVMACEYIKSKKGNCKLIIPFGKYIVGKQNHFDSKKNNENTYINFEGEDIFKFINISNVILEGVKSPRGLLPIIQLSEHIRLGTFELNGEAPNDFDKFNIHPLNHYDSLYKFCAAPGVMLSIKECNNISVSNIKFDGNIANLNIGGNWSGATSTDLEKKAGVKHIEINNHGIAVSNSSNIKLENMVINNFGGDGIYINCNDKTESFEIRDCKLNNNQRQGLSWVGGNNLKFVNSQINNTGIIKKDRKSHRFSLITAPRLGIDIEPSFNKSCTNGYFENIIINGCLGGALGIVGDSSSMCKNISFNKCVFSDSETDSFYKTPTVLLVGTVKTIKFEKCKVYGNLDMEANKRSVDFEPTYDSKLVITNTFFSDILPNGKKIKPWYNYLVTVNDFYFIEISSCVFNFTSCLPIFYRFPNISNFKSPLISLELKNNNFNHSKKNRIGNLPSLNNVLLINNVFNQIL